MKTLDPDWIRIRIGIQHKMLDPDTVPKPCGKPVVLYDINVCVQEHRSRLAQITAIWVVSGMVAPNTLPVTINEHQVGYLLRLLGG